MIYSLLKQHQQLAYRRHPMFEKNRFARLITGGIIALALLYLVLAGLLLPTILRQAQPDGEVCHLFNRGMLYLLAFDFYFRIFFQKIPVQAIKPYILFPIGKKRLIHFFLLRSGSSWYNAFWFALLIPFAFRALWNSQGVIGLLGFLAGYGVLFLINNYWYLLCRTLYNERWTYLALPVLVYGALFAAELLLPGHRIGELTARLGEGFTDGNLLCWLSLLLLLCLLYVADFRVQQHAVYKELARVEQTRLRRVSEYRFLERWGEIGEYIRLEIKLRLRNKAVRNQFRTGFLCMLFFSLMLSFSSTYDTDFMKNFISIYNFAVLGMVSLMQIMNIEGNYLDGLMSRKESILSLLRAKYYFHTALLIVPLVLCIPAILTEKITLLTALAYLFTTSGPVYALLFQLAVYNHTTFPLNTQVTGKQGNHGAFQSLLMAVVFFAPMLLNWVLCQMAGKTGGQLILLGVGIAFTLAHPWWLRNVYHRFMKRRYLNMDGFRNTR